VSSFLSDQLAQVEKELEAVFDRWAELDGA
jgi:hypothetical protein